MQLINDAKGLHPFENSKPETLTARILQHSKAKEWEEAISEWDFLTCFRQEHNEESCLCTQGEHKGDEIKELNIIVNRVTGDRARVGSMCVKSVLKGTAIEADLKLFYPLVSGKRRTVSKQIAARACQLGIISEYDEQTCKDIGTKRRWTEESGQLQVMTWIKTKIVAKISPPPIDEIIRMVNKHGGKDLEHPQSREMIQLSTRTIAFYRKHYELFTNERLPNEQIRHWHSVIYFWVLFGPFGAVVDKQKKSTQEILEAA